MWASTPTASYRVSAKFVSNLIRPLRGHLPLKVNCPKGKRGWPGPYNKGSHGRAMLAPTADVLRDLTEISKILTHLAFEDTRKAKTTFFTVMAMSRLSSEPQQARIRLKAKSTPPRDRGREFFCNTRLFSFPLSVEDPVVIDVF